MMTLHMADWIMIQMQTSQSLEQIDMLSYVEKESLYI
jgi:hypothetical protein